MNIRNLLLLWTALWSGYCAAQVQTPQDFQDQLSCKTPQTQQLLNAPIKPDPHDNVWVLEVLEAMGINRYCNELDAHYYAEFLERQAVNDIVQEPIPTLATVRDAIQWERSADHIEGVTANLDHLHDRVLTQAFQLDTWAPRAENVELLRMHPELQMILPGIWLDPKFSEQRAYSPLLSLAFTNRTTRAVEWDVHYLWARHTADAPPDRMFNCLLDGRDEPPHKINHVTVPQGGVVHVVCLSGSTDLKISELDAAWMERLLHGEKQWLLQGPAPEGDRYAYQKTIRRFSTAQSGAQATPVIRSLSCNQRVNCVSAKAAVMTSETYQLVVVGGPSALAGALLVWLFSWGRRANMPGVANRLIRLVSLLGVAGVVLILLNGAKLGMGAVVLLYLAVPVVGGLIAGMFLLRLWAMRLRKEPEG